MLNLCRQDQRFKYVNNPTHHDSAKIASQNTWFVVCFLTSGHVVSFSLKFNKHFRIFYATVSIFSVTYRYISCIRTIPLIIDGHFTGHQTQPQLSNATLETFLLSVVMVQSFVSFCVNTSVRDFRHHKVNIVKQPIQNRFISSSARLEMASVIAIVIKIGVPHLTATTLNLVSYILALLVYYCFCHVGVNSVYTQLPFCLYAVQTYW